MDHETLAFRDPAEYPSFDEIMQLADAVFETAVRIRGTAELRYTHEGSPDAGRELRQYAYPVPDEIPQYAVDRDTNRYLGTAEDYAKLRAYYSWIPDYFRTTIGPELAGFATYAERLAWAGSTVYNRTAHTSEVDLPLTEAMGYLQHWQGDTPPLVRMNFVGPLGDIARAHSMVAELLSQALQAHVHIYGGVRNSLKDAASAAIAALDSANRAPGASTVLSIASALATLFAVANPPVAIAGWTFISAGAGIGAAIEGSNPPVVTDFAADSVDGVLDRMVEGIIRIRESVVRQEQRIIDVLQTNLDVMRAQRDHFVARHPTFVPTVIDKEYLSEFKAY